MESSVTLSKKWAHSKNISSFNSQILIDLLENRAKAGKREDTGI
jgi:hypothetical protein